MRFTIHNKITLTYTILFIIIFLSLGTYLSSFFQEEYIDTIGEHLVNNAKLISRSITDLNGIEEHSMMVSETLGVRVTIIDVQGYPLAETSVQPQEMENHIYRPEVQSALRGLSVTSTRYSTTLGNDMLYSAAPIYNNDGEMIGVLRLAKSLEEIDITLSKIRFAILGTSFIGIVITWVFGNILSGAITSSIEKLTRKAKSFGKGNFSPVTEIASRDEIGELEQVFNEMGQSIGIMMENTSKERARVENILKNLPVGVLVVDQSGIVKTSNGAAREILSTDVRGVNKPLIQLTRDLQVNDFVKNLLNGDEQPEIEISLQNNEKDNQYIRLKGNGIYKNREDKYEEIVVVLQDISDLRILEKMRKDLVANVSHELRTPVTAIWGFAETLLDGGVDEETSKHFLGIIKGESLRLSRLITDLLNLSKLESSEQKRKEGSSNLRACVESVVDLLKESIESKKHKVQIDIDKYIVLAVDKDYVEQVLVNYMENSVKYTPEGTSITVVAEPQDDGFVRIVVIDNGPGIPQKDQKRIFERFFRVEKSRQRHEGGTGLGLAIVKHVVEGFKGQVGVMSNEKSTAFWATLPLKK